MTLRPFSESHRGLFVSVDGPSGAGTSMIVAHLARLLIAGAAGVHQGDGHGGRGHREWRSRSRRRRSLLRPQGIRGRGPAVTPAAAECGCPEHFAALVAYSAQATRS